MGLFEDRLKQQLAVFNTAKRQMNEAAAEYWRMTWVRSVKPGSAVVLRTLKNGNFGWKRRACTVVAVRRSRKCSSGIQIKVDDGEDWRDSGWFEQPSR